MSKTSTHLIRNRIKEIKFFLYFVTKHFFEDNCALRASSLSFVSLLAIVPLMSVGFAILSSFPVFQKLSGSVQDFVFANFVPATGEVIKNYLGLFATQLSKLSTIGTIFLFITGLLLILSIEESLNKIWRVSTHRHGVRAFLLYWAILSLTPFLLGLSMAVSSYIISMPLIGEHTPSLVISYIPFLFSFFGFTLLYLIVPNCPVKLLHGIYGGFVAALLFESAKIIFVWSMTKFNTYQLLYGAFAAVPIFIVWIYWVWLITLIGAEICYAFSVHHERRQGTPMNAFIQVLAWLHQLWIAQQQGKGLSLNKLINVSSEPFEIDIGIMVSTMLKAQLIQATVEGDYVLSRDLERFTLIELIELLPFRLPHAEILFGKHSPIAPSWYESLRAYDAQLQNLLHIHLSDLFEGQSHPRDDLKNISS